MPIVASGELEHVGFTFKGLRRNVDLVYDYQEGEQRVARKRTVKMAEGILNRVTDF